MLSTLITATVAFVATNIDDMFVLMIFFSLTDQHFRRRHIVTGQYLGFLAIIAVSLVGFGGSFIVSKEWIGLLGSFPVAIGVYRLVGRHSEPKASEHLGRLSTSSSVLSSILSPNTYGVASVTVANGGDNIGIYTPLFATSDLPQVVATVSVFLILVAVWCFLSYKLTQQRTVAHVLSRYGRVLVPFVLIGLGIYIIVTNGTLRLLGF